MIDQTLIREVRSSLDTMLVEMEDYALAKHQGSRFANIYKLNAEGEARHIMDLLDEARKDDTDEG